MSFPTPSPPLWRLLQAAAGVVAAVRDGRSTGQALDRLEPALRAGAQALSFHALRGLGLAEALRRQLARRTPPPEADALLCTVLALAARPAEDGEGAGYAPHTLVSQAVEAAKQAPATVNQAPFINGCLRRFLREREPLLAAACRGPQAQWNHPAWWVERLRQDHPRHWQAILEAGNGRAALTLRINPRRIGRPAFMAHLQAAGLPARPVGAQGLVLARSVPVPSLPGYAQGWFSVQDAGAQLAAPLLLAGLPQGRPLHLLDACAAPGGKTAHLLELADAQVLALDVDADRCRRIGQNLARLGLQARVQAADAGDTAAWWDGQPFDGILLDAPCTASGIVRRHPDVRWLRRPDDVEALARQQARLLQALWPLLKPGGQLLYCTCSVFRAEGSAQVQAFLARHKDAQAEPAPGHLLPGVQGEAGQLPDNPGGDHDGFFYARLRKRGA